MSGGAGHGHQRSRLIGPTSSATTAGTSATPWTTAFGLSLARRLGYGATAMEVIEHLPVDQVDTFVKEVRRVVAPGGAFICSTPQNSDGEIPVVPWHVANIPRRTARHLERDFGTVKILSPSPVAAHPMGDRPENGMPYVNSGIRRRARNPQAPDFWAPTWCWTAFPRHGVGAMSSSIRAAPSRRSWTASKSARRSRSSARAPSRAPAMPRWATPASPARRECSWRTRAPV